MALFSDKVRMYAKFVQFVLPYLPQLLLQRFNASIHRLTYKATPDAKVVVIIGGSFAGFFTAQRLISTLPTGYRVVLIERNEHMHYVFNFPRFSVLEGKERTAFIPYDGLVDMAVPGIFERKQANVEQLERNKIVLNTGEEIEFAYCIIATGAQQPFPARLDATTTDLACDELRRVQKEVQGASKIAVVGAGAVGVEMGEYIQKVINMYTVHSKTDICDSTDIKAYYPEKTVMLISSRDYLLPGFGPKLRDHALKATKQLGVEVVLNARPAIREPSEQGGKRQLAFKDGKIDTFDLVIPCTGQSPNSLLLASLSPQSISKNGGRILVKGTLQLEDSELPHIFAVGDVADTGGPRMGRAAFYQANIAAQNVTGVIKGRKLRTYVTNVSIEGAIKLTLGKTDYVMNIRDPDGTELLIEVANGSEDLDVARAWRTYGVQCDEALLAETKDTVKS